MFHLLTPLVMISLLAPLAQAGGPPVRPDRTKVNIGVYVGQDINVGAKISVNPVITVPHPELPEQILQQAPFAIMQSERSKPYFKYRGCDSGPFSLLFKVL